LPSLPIQRCKSATQLFALADLLYSLRQMINLLLPDLVCDKVTLAKIFSKEAFVLT